MEEEEFSSGEEEQTYDPSTPYVVDVVDDNRRQQAYIPMLWKNQSDFNPSPAGVNPTPAALCELYLPDSLLDKWVVSTNAYASSHLPQHKRRNITRSDITRSFDGLTITRCYWYQTSMMETRTLSATGRSLGRLQ